MTRRLIARKPFEFSARVTLQLGRESISSSTVAISELIKNSYDADAENVTLKFYLREHSISTLIIEDDGNGMNAENLMSHWLKIGTDNKSVKEYSAIKNRVLTGAKGLGRLGIDRLCKKLILYTKTEEMDEAIQLNINWSEFENTSKTLSEIQHEIYSVDIPFKDKYGDNFVNRKGSGTRMILLGLKDNWNSNFLNTLENELRLLISPFQAKNEFVINLNVKSAKVDTEKSLNSERLLDAARWKVNASIDSDGYVKCIYTNERKQLDIIQTEIPWHQWIKDSGITPLCGPVNFEFYYIPQDTTELNKLNLKVKDFRAFMNLNQGVRLYRDHFRVRPYGEPSGKGDWLDIGMRKAGSPGGISQPGWRIGPNQILGSVLISRETNTELEDQANREGIIETEAFFQLRKFLLKVISTFELLVYKDTIGDTKTDLAEVLAGSLTKANEDVKEAVDSIKNAISKSNRKKIGRKKHLSPEQNLAKKLSELERLRERQAEAETKYFEQLRATNKQLEEQKNTLSNLASLGILTISFGHEVRQHAGLAKNGSTQILKHLNRMDNTTGLLDKPIKMSMIVKDSAQYIDNFSSFALENIKPDKRNKKKINVPDVFQHVFSMFVMTLDKMGIKVHTSYEKERENYLIYAFEIDWESIVINLLTNSIWALEKVVREQRSIEVNFYEDDNDTIIIFKDSAIGLEAGAEEIIFMPMHSGKRDHIGNSIGTGMGLSIVKTHIESNMSGKISAIAHSDIGGAEFKITIPKSNRK